MSRLIDRKTFGGALVDSTGPERLLIVWEITSGGGRSLVIYSAAEAEEVLIEITDLLADLLGQRRKAGEMNWLKANRLTVKQQALMRELYQRGKGGSLESFLLNASQRTVAQTLVRRGLAEGGVLDTVQGGRCWRITVQGIALWEEITGR